MHIREWLSSAESALKIAGVPSARLDAELLLADALGKSRTWLLAHDDEVITDTALSNVKITLSRRLKREPLAYIRGLQEFYGRAFHVDAHVLIPRPETEIIIEELQAISIRPGDILIDVGTGSGCIGITAKLEYPGLTVYGLDISKAALAIANKNATRQHAEAIFLQSNLLKNVKHLRKVTIITANLPYLGQGWQVSPEVDFEPQIALYADNDGLELIFDLLVQAQIILQSQGHLLLEADPRQHTRIDNKARTLGFRKKSQKDFILHFVKI